MMNKYANKIKEKQKQGEITAHRHIQPKSKYEYIQQCDRCNGPDEFPIITYEYKTTQYGYQPPE